MCGDAVAITSYPDAVASCTALQPTLDDAPHISSVLPLGCGSAEGRRRPSLIGLVEAACGGADPEGQHRSAGRRHVVGDRRGHVGEYNGMLLEGPLGRLIDRGTDGLSHHAVANGEAVHPLANRHYRAGDVAAGDKGIVEPGQHCHILENVVQRVDRDRLVSHQDLTCSDSRQCGRPDRKALTRLALPCSQIVHGHIPSFHASPRRSRATSHDAKIQSIWLFTICTNGNALLHRE